MLTEFFKVCRTHVLQVEIHPLGNQPWFSEKKYSYINEMHVALRGVIEERTSAEMSLARRTRDKHKTLPTFTAPTMLNGPTLRIAYSFKPRAKCSSFLLLTDFSGIASKNEFSSFQFLREKLVIYTLPIETYRNAIQSRQFGDVREIRAKTDTHTALVSDYFNIDPTSRDHSSTNQQQALKTMMKKCKKKRRSHNQRSTTDEVQMSRHQVPITCFDSNVSTTQPESEVKEMSTAEGRSSLDCETVKHSKSLNLHSQCTAQNSAVINCYKKPANNCSHSSSSVSSSKHKPAATKSELRDIGETIHTVGQRGEKLASEHGRVTPGTEPDHSNTVMCDARTAVVKGVTCARTTSSVTCDARTAVVKDVTCARTTSSVTCDARTAVVKGVTCARTTSSDSGTDSVSRRERRNKRAQMLQNIARDIQEENKQLASSMSKNVAESTQLKSSSIIQESSKSCDLGNCMSVDSNAAVHFRGDKTHSLQANKGNTNKSDSVSEPTASKFKFKNVTLKNEKNEPGINTAEFSRNKTKIKNVGNSSEGSSVASNAAIKEHRKRKYGLDISSEEEDFTKCIRKRKVKKCSEKTDWSGSANTKALFSRKFSSKSCGETSNPDKRGVVQGRTTVNNVDKNRALLTDEAKSPQRNNPAVINTSPVSDYINTDVAKKLYNAAKARCASVTSSDVSHCDGTEDKPMEAEDIFSDCFILEALSWTPSKQNTHMEREIVNAQKVCELTESQLEYLVLKNERYLRQIFQGKVYNRRHEDYKKGGKARVDLTYQINIGLFKEEQQDTVMETLIGMFCSKHNKYFDYVMRVMLPEILIKIYMDVHHVTHKQTEAEMAQALTTRGAIFK